MSARAPEVRARELGHSFDLLAAFDPSDGFFMERNGLGISTSGETVRVAVEPGEGQLARGAEAVAQALADIGPAPIPPVAVGAFPFEPTSEAVIVVPRRSIRRFEDGQTKAMEIGEPFEASGPPPPDVWGPSEPSAEFETMRLKHVPTPAGYASAVDAAVVAIKAGKMRKVVLARTLEVDAGRRLDPRRLLQRLRAVDPASYAFAVPAGTAPEDGLLVGASPELLVSCHGTEVRANPLAGSAPRAGDPDEDRRRADALLADPKDREEHAIVVEAVAAALEPVCAELTWDREPVLLETANVWHLSTRFRGTLTDPSTSALDLVAALHPTPAVCGDPRGTALSAIRKLEPFDRGRYSGPVGWIDADGDGEWAIALRCAQLRADRAILYAGAGIVAASDPAAEVEETDRKFRAFLDALRWG